MQPTIGRMQAITAILMTPEFVHLLLSPPYSSRLRHQTSVCSRCSPPQPIASRAIVSDSVPYHHPVSSSSTLLRLFQLDRARTGNHIGYSPIIPKEKKIKQECNIPFHPFHASLQSRAENNLLASPNRPSLDTFQGQRSDPNGFTFQIPQAHLVRRWCNSLSLYTPR